MHFAKWVYHKTKEAKIVHSEDAFKTLGPEWSETPFCEGEFPFEKEEQKQKEETKKRGRPAKAKE